MTNESENDNNILDPVELRDYLAIRGVTTSLSDSQLCTMIKYKIQELSGLIGIDVLPTQYTEMRKNYNDNMILLNHYPVSSIISIHNNNNLINSDEYTLDANLGIIYFKHNQFGDITTAYESCLPVHLLKTIFIPLLVDTIEYSLPENKGKYGVTSVKEGDVSVNYSTTDSLGSTIQKRIDKLRNYHTRIRVL